MSNHTWTNLNGNLTISQINTAVSSQGQRQVLNGEIVLNPSDRQAIANLFRLLSTSPLAQIALRQAGKTQK